MSLLMEALKKAEEAKRQAAAQADTPSPPAGEPTLVPLDPPPAPPAQPAAGSPLPDLAQHLAAVDADLAAVSTEAPPRRRAGSPAASAVASTPPPLAAGNAPPVFDLGQTEAARSMARNAFAAKQPSPRRTLWWIGGLAVLAALAIVGYFGWQLQGTSSTPRLAAARSAQPPHPTTAFPTPPPPAPASPPPAPTVQPAQPPAAASPPSVPANVSRGSEAPAARVRPAEPPADAAAPLAALRLSRSQPQVHPRLERGYIALQGGRLDEARSDYAEVLKSDPRNTDALLGLATVARRQGQGEAALGYYQRVLEADPSEPTALAAIVSNRAQADPAQAESRLKNALVSQPTSAALHFALGNLYARQERWAEAQQAFFQAYSNDPENADILFNLAVSLDHLRQGRLAARYYQLALDTAGTPNAMRSAAFAPEAVRQRLLELQP